MISLNVIYLDRDIIYSHIPLPSFGKGNDDMRLRDCSNNFKLTTQVKLKLNFIFLYKQFFNRFHKSVDIACPYRYDNIDSMNFSFSIKSIFTTSNFHGTCYVFQKHI